MSEQIACLHCDLLSELTVLKHREEASCPRCGLFLTRHLSDANHHLLSNTFSALIFLALANAGPFLSFGAGGIESSMHLIETPTALWAHGMPLIALLVAALILAIPALVLVLMLVLGIAMEYGYYRSWLPSIARGIFQCQHWAMVEVFLIGVIVALVKLTAMATVIVGTALWAYAAFTVCFILANTSLDRYQCWKWIERMQSAKAKC